MFSSMSSLAFFCGVAAFYAQQTDQQNLFFGFAAAAVLFVIQHYRSEIAWRDRETREDMFHNRLEEVEKNFREEIKEIQVQVSSTRTSGR